MAATMKHRRSASKSKMTKAADRYDVQLKKYKKIKKKGGSPVVKLGAKNYHPAHRVSKENPEYKGYKFISTKSKKK